MERINKNSTFLASGEGFSYEDHIGAFYLSSLLKNGVVYGMQHYQIEKISFQQANLGNPVDDFVIEGSNCIQKAKLSLQAKHNISFGANEEFTCVIKACADLFLQPNFNKDIDKFGVIVGVFNKSIDQHYKNLNKLAINTTSGAEFEELINNQSNTSITFYQVIKSILSEKMITEIPDIWQFCKCFVILYLQHSEPSSLSFFSLNNINEITQDITENQKIYNALLLITNSCRTTGGSINRQSLIVRFKEQGISVLENPNSKTLKDYKKIVEFGEQALNNIKQDINGIQANRDDLLNEIEVSIQKTSNLLMLIGTEGTGKSAILKNLAMKYKEQKNCIVFSDKIFSHFNDGGWQGFSNYLKMDCALESIIYSLISNGKDIYLFIDGVDFINELNKRAIFKELINTIKKINDEVDFTYKIITTGRLSSNQQWLVDLVGKNNTLVQAIDFKIENHTDFLDKLSINSNFYKYGNDRFKPIFSNLFMLEIFSNIDTPENVNTEWDITKLWWNKYIIEPELKTFLLDFGEKLINNPTEWQNISQTAIANKLLQNTILIKNDYECYYTRHDIYRDWLIALLCDSFYSKSIDSFKSKLSQLDIIYTNYYLKPFAIFASKLITTNKYQEWLDLYKWSTENKLLTWKQGLLESVLSAASNTDKLDEFLDTLVDNDEILKDILDYLYSTKINFQDKQFFVSYNIWKPFVCWLANNTTKLYFYEEIHKIFCIWRYCFLSVGNFYFSEIADVYKHWLTLSRDKKRDIRHHRYVWYKEDEILRELIFLSIYKPEYIEEELHRKFKHHDEIDIFLLGMCSEILIDKFPQLYADFIFNNVTYSIEELSERKKDWHYNLAGYEGSINRK